MESPIDKKRASGWLRAQSRPARRRARLPIGLGLVNTALAIVQAGCMADVLGTALAGGRERLPWAIGGFAAPRWRGRP